MHRLEHQEKNSQAVPRIRRRGESFDGDTSWKDTATGQCDGSLWVVHRHDVVLSLDDHVRSAAMIASQFAHFFSDDWHHHKEEPQDQRPALPLCAPPSLHL